MFETRSEMEQLLAVAEAGRIVAAAERLAMTQPALTRAVAKLERRAGARLFERVPSGVRLTALGAVALERARRLLGELADADEHLAETVAGRDGRLRVSASPLWMRTVVTPAAVRFHSACPGVGLTLRTVPFSEGVRLLDRGESDLHCGGVDGGQALPALLRREPLLKVTAGIVAGRDHPLQRARPTPDDLVRSPWLDWLDGYTSARTSTAEGGVSLGAVLARLHERTGERAGPVFRTGAAAGLLLLAEGPWLAWLPFAFVVRSPELGLKPLPLVFGRRRYRTGLVARRAAEDLAPVRLLEDLVRDIARERLA